MNLILHRTEESVDGIFGVMTDEFGSQVCVTLEHSFQNGSGYAPKIPPGQYNCIRGQHQLAHMAHPFTAFMLENVPNHSNILIHMGNYNKDSDGCILVGATRVSNMITSSDATFDKFMSVIQKDVDNFTLIVE